MWPSMTFEIIILSQLEIAKYLTKEIVRWSLIKKDNAVWGATLSCFNNFLCLLEILRQYFLFERLKNIYFLCQIYDDRRKTCCQEKYWVTWFDMESTILRLLCEKFLVSVRCTKCYLADFKFKKSFHFINSLSQ